MMILARHAESLYWVGRFLERTEMTSRWLDVASHANMHRSQADAAPEWARLLRSLGLESGFAKTGKLHEQVAVAYYLLSAESNPGSVTASLASLRNNLRVVRDRIPVELWEECNSLHLRLASVDVERQLNTEPHEIYTMVRSGCQAVGGVISEAMTRDEGHAFIEIGRMLERSILTVRLLLVAHESDDPEIDGVRLLRSTSAMQAYHRLHGHNADVLSTSQFLLEAPNVPRSVLSCLRRAEGRLLAAGAEAGTLIEPRRLAGRLRSQLEFDDIREELESDPTALLQRTEQSLQSLAALVSSQVFRPAGEPVLHAQFIRPGRAT